MENSTTAKKSSWAWRILRWGLIGVAGLVTVAALLWAEENWRGKRDWENYKKEWEAKGEKFDLAAFIPPPVPDEENFAMTPFLAPLFDFNSKPLKEGESIWRDTNAVNKVEDFGKDLSYPQASGSWVRSHRMDLTAWASALNGKKDAPASGESSSARAEAAKMVLEKMKKYEPVLEELRAASRRPHCQFKIAYPGDDPQGILYPHLSVLKRAGIMFGLRACAGLAAGKSDAALGDVEMILYIEECMKEEPVLLPGLVRISIVSLALQPIWEGLADHRWTDAQVKELQERLEKIDLLTGYETSMRSERAYGNAVLDYQRRARRLEVSSENEDGTMRREYMLNWMPSGFYYQNQVLINRLHQEIILPTVDPGKHRIFLDLSTNADARIEKELKGRFVMYSIFAQMLFPAFAKAEQKFALAQVQVDEGVIACALERYRLAHGQFPDTLDELSPQFTEKVPADVVTGEPLKYRRTQDGQFVLYSVGWNGVDDGGTVAMTKDKVPRVDITQGDWVWKYAAK